MPKYPLTGPFVNNSTPGISATFLNNLETYLGYGADSNITADGSGNATVASITFTRGSVTRIAFGFNAATTGGTVITHNLGVVPSCFVITPNNLSVTFNVSAYTSTQMTVTVSTNCNVWWLALA